MGRSFYQWMLVW